MEKTNRNAGGDLFNLLFDFNSALYISLVFLKGDKLKVKY